MEGKRKLTETKLIVQPENSNPFWKKLLRELAKKFEGKMKIVFPTEWNKHYFNWFHGMEEMSFRRELQYSFKEVMKSFENSEPVFWFITVNNEPQILLLGYSIIDEEEKSFYLDTFAVKRRGEDIGDIVLEHLIRWAKTKHFNAIILETELFDEKGIPLQRFYREHGFEIISISEKGSVIMKRVL